MCSDVATMDFLDFEKLILAGGILGIFGGATFYGWVANRLTKRLEQLNIDLSPLQGGLKTVAATTAAASDAVGEATQALSDGVITEAEAQEFMKVAARIAKDVKEKTLEV
ncbi:MAG: hypothetical protein AAF609_23270 [Cyanobacteria bacterium P01_C01_bin.120]